jgi:hypothetical protein
LDWLIGPFHPEVAGRTVIFNPRVDEGKRHFGQTDTMLSAPLECDDQVNKEREPTREQFWDYFKHSLRMFSKNPGFTLAAIAALALGIGTNTAIFTVVNAVLLKPLTYPDADRIVQFQLTSPASSCNCSPRACCSLSPAASLGCCLATSACVRCWL